MYQKSRIMNDKYIFFVKYRSDGPHKWELVSFSSLKKAKDFARNLPLTPQGFQRKVIIEKWTYFVSNITDQEVAIIIEMPWDK